VLGWACSTGVGERARVGVWHWGRVQGKDMVG